MIPFVSASERTIQQSRISRVNNNECAPEYPFTIHTELWLSGEKKVGLLNPFFQFQRIGGGDEGILEEFEVNRGDEDPCYERPCTANEHCCPAQVCIDVDGGRSFPNVNISNFSRFKRTQAHVDRENCKAHKNCFCTRN